MCNPFPDTGVTGGSNPYEERKNCRTPRWSARGKRKKSPVPVGGRARQDGRVVQARGCLPTWSHHNNIIALHYFKAWSFIRVLLRTPVAFLCAASLLRPLGVLRQLCCWCCYCGVFHGNGCTTAATAGLSVANAVPVLLMQGVLRQLLYGYCYCSVFYGNYDYVLLTSNAAFAAVMRLHTTSIGLLLRYGQNTTRGEDRVWAG